MRRRTAAILFFFCSERSRGPSHRHLLGRAAWRALSAAASRGDRNAVEAVWRGWLRNPDDERWELLCRWRGAQPMAEAVFAAAADPARPPATRAALGAFCAGHGLAPAGPAERARYYLLTAQPGQQRAADPDGSALAAAYQAGDEPVRAALRQAMANYGELDLVRVVASGKGDASRGADTAAATQAERAYLTAELARRRDWARLWRLALDLPLAETIAAARLLPAGWQAPDENGQRLLARLAAASPAAVTALTTPVATRLDTGTTVSVGCQFAPDGSEAAIRMRRPPPLGGMRLPPGDDFTTMYALPGGGRLETFVRRDSSGLSSPDTLPLGPATVSAEDFDGGYRLVRHVRGHGFDQLDRWYIFQNLKLVQVKDGFVVTMYGRLRHGTAEPGSWLRDVARSSIGDYTTRYGSARLVAGEPRTGRIAVLTGRTPSTLVVLGPDFEVIAAVDCPQADGEPIGQIGFCGPSVVITRDEPTARFRSWHVGPPMAAEATTELPYTFPLRFQALPSAGLIVIEAEPTIGIDGTLRRNTARALHEKTTFRREYLDARTLQPVACPATLEWARQDDGGLKRIARLYLSPDGGYAALTRLPKIGDGRANEIEVRDLVVEEIRELVPRPLARSRPADLAAVADLAARARGGDARKVLGLLRACLEYRFGDEVAIGQDMRPVTGPHDIAVSRPGALEHLTSTEPEIGDIMVR